LTAAKSKSVVKKVKVADDFYSPTKLTIKVGDKVNFVWSPSNVDTHNMTLVAGPKGVSKKQFTSLDGSTSFHFEKTFTVPGKYHFRCTIHPTMMNFFLTVRSRREVPSSPIGCGGFLAGAAAAAGGAALVTLGGLEYHADARLDVEAMGRQMEVPPAVANYYNRQSQTGYVAALPAPTAGGITRPYWIKAVKVPSWDIVPSHRDGMMDRPIKGKTKITAIAYQRFTPGFKKPMGRPQIPGPLIEADVGDTYWVGPDTMHSVTGDSPNDLGIDSDPGNPEPMHKVGFTFTVVFTQPGVYMFHCKLHNIVHGEVIVSDTPGSPNDDPDPIPTPKVNLMQPSLSSLHLRPQQFGTRGTTLDYALDDTSSIDSEIWHLTNGHRGAYAGWQELHGHIGPDYGPFARRGPHFKPARGRYVRS
jgi:plastocyanin